MSDAYTINNNQEAIRELHIIRSCFKPISVQYQSLSMAMESLQMIDELPNSEVLIPKSRIEDIKADIEENISHYEHFSSSNTANGLNMALQIIDKHISGKEQANEVSD